MTKTHLPLRRDGTGTGRYLTHDGRYGIGVGDDTWTDQNGKRQGYVDWQVYRTEQHEDGEFANLFYADTLTECRDWLAAQLASGRLS